MSPTSKSPSLMSGKDSKKKSMKKSKSTSRKNFAEIEQQNEEGKLKEDADGDDDGYENSLDDFIKEDDGESDTFIQGTPKKTDNEHSFLAADGCDQCQNGIKC